MKKPKLPSLLKKTLDGVICDLKKIKEVRAVYLFGSYAKGTARPLSDVDLAVIPSRKLSFEEKAEVCSHTSPQIQIMVFDDLPLYIQHRVFKEGILLYGQEDLFLHRKKMACLTEYLDFRWLIDKQIRRVFG